MIININPGSYSKPTHHSIPELGFAIKEESLTA